MFQHSKVRIIHPLSLLESSFSGHWGHWGLYPAITVCVCVCGGVGGGILNRFHVHHSANLILVHFMLCVHMWKKSQSKVFFSAPCDLSHARLLNVNAFGDQAQLSRSQSLGLSFGTVCSISIVTNCYNEWTANVFLYGTLQSTGASFEVMVCQYHHTTETQKSHFLIKPQFHMRTAEQVVVDEKINIQTKMC